MNTSPTRPLIIGPTETQLIRMLRRFAAVRPVDIVAIKDAFDRGADLSAHREQMTEQTIELPQGYFVTLSIETGHPAGTCRHLSLSVAAMDNGPAPEAVQLIAHELGFSGPLGSWTLWIETTAPGVRAINAVQPVIQHEAGTT